MKTSHTRFSSYKKVVYKKVVLDRQKPQENISTSSKKLNKSCERFFQVKLNCLILNGRSPRYLTVIDDVNSF